MTLCQTLERRDESKCVVDLLEGEREAEAAGVDSRSLACIECVGTNDGDEDE